MKTGILTIAICFFSILISQAQTTLPDSPKRSTEAYIFTIDQKHLKKIYSKGDNITEDMLGKKVATYQKGAPLPKIPRCNYMIVESIENKLNFTDHIEDDLYFKIVPAENFMLCLYDSLGNIIKDAIVKSKSKRVKFDKKTQTYNTSSIKNERIIEINHNGVFHYIEIEKNRGYYYANYNPVGFNKVWRKTKRDWYDIKYWVRGLFNSDYRVTKINYTGFIVFSKPKYKPNETVKLKAHITDTKGRPYNKPVKVRLYSYYPSKVDTILATIDPYRAGMFEYEFKLSDNPGLWLDANYSISLLTHDDKYHNISSQFKYEEYELKSIHFSMTTDKEEYAKGDSVNIKIKLTDQNEMAVFGGRAEIVITSNPKTFTFHKKNETVFIPDILWHEEIDMNENSEKTITLPDSIFPSNVSFDYKIHCTYLSTDNEKQEQTKHLYHNSNEHTIDFALSKGILTIRQLHKGESQSIEGKISIKGEDDKTIYDKTVQLPHVLPLPWHATTIKIETNDTHDHFYPHEKIKEDPMSCEFYRANDSIFLKVDNPANIPFWYVVRKDKKDIASGYTTQLNYAIKDKNKGYSMQLSYILGESEKKISRSLPVAQKNMSLHVSTPTVVYPGQKTDVKIAVTNKKGKPISDADITAYSFTSKFESSAMPSIAIKGKAKYAKEFRNTNYESDERGLINKKGYMTWEKWKLFMALDTIEYYKFLYPKTYYHYSEPTIDGSTQLSPYVVVDGVIQSIPMLWIDEKLYYTNLAEQYEEYVFRVDSGIHNIRFRTHDREVKVHNVLLRKKTKNIISFNATKPYTKITYPESNLPPFVISSQLLKKEEQGRLSDKDINYLSNRLITIDNNFGTLELPNQNVSLDLPAYIHSGNNYYYINQTSKRKYNYTLRGYLNDPILIGPFPTKNYLNGMSNIASVFAENQLIAHIDLEERNHYTVYKNYQKIKNWQNTPFRKELRWRTPPTDFNQKPILPPDIESMFTSKIENLLKTSHGEIRKTLENTKPNSVQLNLNLGYDTEGKNINPSFIFFLPEKEEEIANYKLYYGATRHFSNLPPGKTTLHLIMNDSTSFSKVISLHSGGQNYLHIDSIEYESHKSIAKDAYKLFNRQVRKKYTRNPYTTSGLLTDSVTIKENSHYRQRNINPDGAIGVVLDSSGEPLIGANIFINKTDKGTITDFEGEFELMGGKEGDEIVISYIGYISKTITYIPGSNYRVILEEDTMTLDETVVVGYGSSKLDYISTAEDISEALPGISVRHFTGSTQRVFVRGMGSIEYTEPPLIIINGLPYHGSLEDIDPGIISTINVLKDSSATSLYGAKAGNGVIVIETNGFSPTQQETTTESEWIQPEMANSIRRNFHDDAFWQPRLRTDKKGMVSFEVTYPDDITSWNAYFIAIGNKKQADKKQMTIKSYKALTSQLSLPRFAISGDSLNAVGRIANHLGNEVQVMRRIELEESQKEDQFLISTSHTDYIPVVASEKDSLKITYSLEMANGYFDGEERLIPIYEQGMLQTSGEFKVINDHQTHIMHSDPNLGVITIHAEASSIELFLREIDKVDNYPYLCNEQIASKIKVLLAKKRIYKILGKEYKDNNKIVHLISLLNKNRNSENLWGWWSKSQTQYWISKQVISAMLEAEKEGFTTNFNKSILAEKLEEELKKALLQLRIIDKEKLPFAKENLMDQLLYLKQLNSAVAVEPYFREIEGQLENKSVNDKLKTMHVMSVIGLQKDIQVDSLLKDASKTILGSIYWENKKQSASILLPYQSNLETTLIAYHTLKNIGGYEEELKKIRNYFFECRHSGSWRNTYESSRIIETILPDMLNSQENYSEVSMYLNEIKISEFPYTEKLETEKPFEIRKEGTAPLFVTAYQQSWNANPKEESSKGFTIKSYFKTNNETASHLIAGKVAQLEVVVKVDGEANYVQLEVPIPAGCSYETKGKGVFWKETHREYFKEKVVIFSNQLTKGEHTFYIDLMPRYSGFYHLNPAKVELMYFPTFYGNEEMKKVLIENKSGFQPSQEDL